MKKLLPLFLVLLLIVSCGNDDEMPITDDNVNDNQLSTPLLLIPANNSAVSTNSFNAYTITFEWSEVLNASQYLLEVSDNADFSNIILTGTQGSNIAGPFFGDNFNVFPNGTYYWRVRALGAGFEPSNYSEPFSFNFTSDIGGGTDDDIFTDDDVQGSVYGTYTGVFSTNGEEATILIPGIGGLDGEVLDDTPFSLSASQVAGSPDSINVDITLQVTVSGSAVPVPITLNAGYDAAAKTFTRTNTDISISLLGGAVNIDAYLVELDGAFDGDDVSGSIELDDPSDAAPGTNNIDATLFFTATKQ